MASWAEFNSDGDYLRQARRLRSRYAAKPAELHRRLAELSDSIDLSTPAPRGRDLIPHTPQQDFARLVRSRIQAGVLRYSDRQVLLAWAEQAGIERFEANLLIATVQHQVKRRLGHISPPDRSRRWSLAIAALVIQSAIVSAFWWLLA